MPDATKKEVWDTLSATDYEPHVIVDPDGIKLLQAMSAHSLMMSVYPDYTYEFIQDGYGRDLHYLEDGSAEVRLTMTVAGNTKAVSLPIHRNMQAIKNPSSWDLSTAKQRLRVRAMGEFGLAHDLWITKADNEPVFAEEPQPVVPDITQADEYWQEADLASCTNIRALDRKHSRYLNALRTSKIDNNPHAEDYLRLKALLESAE